jgi:predicted Zn finger-like uncharacterized protein
MIVTCPACATRYQVPDTVFASGRGRHVRCRCCAFEWRTVPDDASDQTPEVAVPELERDFAAHLAATEQLEQNLVRLRGRDIESAAMRQRVRLARRLGSIRGRRLVPLALAACLALVVAVGALSPNRVARNLPAAAGLYAALGVAINLRGMEFADVAVRRETEDGIAVLTVSGVIVNLTGQTVDLPAVRIGLRDADRREIRHWTATVEASVLAPGASVPFFSRLAAPPGEAADVLIRFDDTPALSASRRG